MLFFLTFCLLVGFSIQNFFSQLLPISSELQQHCLEMSPQSPWRPFYQAIVCGSSLPLTQEYRVLRDLGLIHIIVVSGSHLVFLSQLLQPLPLVKKTWIVLIILFAFVLMTGMEAPVLRAFLFLCLFWWSQHHKLFYSSYKILLGSVFLIVGLQPELALSRSLLMSWAASLGIHLGKNIFSQSIFCYFLLLPLILDFSELTPLSILVNCTLTPLTSFILFPLSLLSFILPISSFIDELWQLLFHLGSLSLYRTHIPTIQSDSYFSTLFYWAYLLFINFVAIQWHDWKKLK